MSLTFFNVIFIHFSIRHGAIKLPLGRADNEWVKTATDAHGETVIVAAKKIPKETSFLVSGVYLDK